MNNIKLLTILLILTPIISFAQNRYLAEEVNEAINAINFENQNYDISKKIFHSLRDKYLKLSKENKRFDSFLNLGAIYACGKMFFSGFNSVDSALFYLVKAKEINPTIPEIYNLFGLTYYGIGNFRYAIEYYKRALKYDTRSEYKFCYEGIVDSYFLNRNPHMTLLYSQFLNKKRTRNDPVLLEQLELCKNAIKSDYPVSVKIDSTGTITYKNTKMNFVAQYPFLWTEAEDIPYDSERNESILNLTLEEIKDKNDEYTLSAIIIIANDSKISFDEFMVKTLNEFKYSGKVKKNPIRLLKNSFEFQIIDGKFVITTVFIEGKSDKYAVLYSTTSAAYDLDFEKFKNFLNSFKINE